MSGSGQSRSDILATLVNPTILEEFAGGGDYFFGNDAAGGGGGGGYGFDQPLMDGFLGFGGFEDFQGAGAGDGGFRWDVGGGGPGTEGGAAFAAAATNTTIGDTPSQAGTTTAAGGETGTDQSPGSYRYM